MEIQIKEIKKDGSEFIIYLLDDNGNPLFCDIVNYDNKIDKLKEYMQIHSNMNNNSSRF